MRGLIGRIEAITAAEPRRHWLARLEAHGIPCGPINNYAEAFADPQIRAREMVVEIDHPTLGPPADARLARSRCPRRRRSSAAARRCSGEHTGEVLREAGCSDEEIASIVAGSG